MCVYKYHAFIYFLRPPPWSGTFVNLLSQNKPLNGINWYPGLIRKNGSSTLVYDNPSAQALQNRSGRILAIESRKTFFSLVIFTCRGRGAESSKDKKAEKVSLPSFLFPLLPHTFAYSLNPFHSHSLYPHLGRSSLAFFTHSISSLP
jgi:hypothetical protein